jgi:carbamate kinase
MLTLNASPGSTSGRCRSFEAVIDEDDFAALLADRLVFATDVDGFDTRWGTPAQRAWCEASVAELERDAFAASSMQAKVSAACRFVRRTGHRAAIGSLDAIEALVAGEVGTCVLPL